MPPEPTLEQEQAMADERACGERISYWLKKYACTIVPVVEISAGNVQTRVDIVKIPPEIQRQLKQAEKEATSKPVAPPSPSPAENPTSTPVPEAPSDGSPATSA